jgi:hypothetical protein
MALVIVLALWRQWRVVADHGVVHRVPAGQ